MIFERRSNNIFLRKRVVFTEPLSRNYFGEKKKETNRIRIKLLTLPFEIRQKKSIKI